MVAALAAGCGDTALPSDLPDGPLRVASVHVTGESIRPSAFSDIPSFERATFCHEVSEEVKLSIEFCPEGEGGEPDVSPVDDARPAGFEVRVVFSSLLDPSIETLEETADGLIVGSIDDARPLSITCAGEEVPYTGFYDPGGNHLTFPPGPALFVQATEFVGGTGADCELFVEPVVTDKDGEAVQNPGPFEFSLAPLAVARDPASGSPQIAPPNGASGVRPEEPTFSVAYNAELDEGAIARPITLHEIEAAVDPETGAFEEVGVIREVAVELSLREVDPAVIEVSPTADLEGETHYRLRATTAGLADVAGGASLGGDEPVVSIFFTRPRQDDGDDDGDGGSSDTGRTR